MARGENTEIVVHCFSSQAPVVWEAAVHGTHTLLASLFPHW